MERCPAVCDRRAGLSRKGENGIIQRTDWLVGFCYSPVGVETAAQPCPAGETELGGFVTLLVAQVRQTVDDVGHHYGSVQDLVQDLSPNRLPPMHFYSTSVGDI